MSVVILAATFLVSYFATWRFIGIALKLNLLDTPNYRSSHTVPTPRGGGLAIILAFVVVSIVLAAGGYISWSWALLVVLPATVVAIVGFVDDRKHVPSAIRFLVHLIAAFCAVYFAKVSFDLPPMASLAVFAALLIGIAWLLNLYNFMDGIDGIAASEAICVALGMALVFWTNGDTGMMLWLLSLAAASAGFLVWNWPPAKIFMGDAGSGFLGFVFGALAVVSATISPILFCSWLIMLGVFLADASVTLLRRALTGQKWYAAHRSHAYQYACRRYGSHKKVTIGVLVINIFWLSPLAVLNALFPELALILLVIAYLPLIFLCFRFSAGREEQQVT